MKKYFVSSLMLVMTLAVFLPNLALAKPYAYFSDVTSSHHNVTAINWLAANGVVQGYSDGTFRPDSPINRAEFLKMLYETIGMVGYDTELRFIDVPTYEWYVQYVKEAFATGVVDGYPDGTFRPASYINFAEAVKIVMNGFFDVDALYGDGSDYLLCNEGVSVADYEEVDTSAWYWKYLHTADEMCLLSYGLWGFDPNALITRADMAAMLYEAKTVKDNELTKYSSDYVPNDIIISYGDDGLMPPPFSLSSSDFVNNGMLDAMHTCDGADWNPYLTIANVPNNAVSLALMVDDPDAPSGSWTHWLVWNIDPDTAMIYGDGGMYPPLPTSAVEGTSGSNILGWEGPCPPLEDGPHHYYFYLYALDTDLDLMAGANKMEFEAAIEGHVIETAQIVGLYDAN